MALVAAAVAALMGGPGAGGAGASNPATAPAPSPAAAGAPLATPVLSPRRLPRWLSAAAATAELDAALDAALAAPAPTSTCLTVERAGRPLYSLRGHDELIPASAMKLLTATAALDKLGPSFRYVTTVTASAPPVGGVVGGDLYLVGGGDPLLRTPSYVNGLAFGAPVYTSLDQLAAQVAAAGVTDVTGGVIGDESRYDSQRGVPSWKPSYLADGDVGPLSALEVNDGLLDATPGVTPGAPPPLQAAQLFTRLLRRDGVHVAGAAGTGTSPASATRVTSIDSPPLAQVVGEVLRESDDTGAELITKELGRRFAGEGSTDAGVAVIRSDLAADRLPVGQLVAVDGSGLSRTDRVTCDLLQADLDRAGPASVLAAALPVAGRSGTLRYRMTSPPAAGRVMAKTGTLDGVASLAGYVTPEPGQGPGLTFALVLNGLASEAQGLAIGDRVASALARFPGVPPPAQLGPLK